jgi:hypothetical protein
VREIDTRIAADLKGHSGYRNTLMATDRKEMDVGIWIQLRRDFINFCKPF